MSNELKPCPFCGSDDLITSLGPAVQNGRETVMCNQCGSDAAYRTWNNRAWEAEKLVDHGVGGRWHKDDGVAKGLAAYRAQQEKPHE